METPWVWVIRYAVIKLLLIHLTASWRMFNICSEPEVNGAPGVIVTPNKFDYSHTYAPGLDCRTNITTGNPDGGSIKLEFWSFDTNWDGDSCLDPLTVNGTEYCGVYTGLELCFVAPSLELHFQSDFERYVGFNNTGFKIRFVTSEDNQCECLTESEEGETAQTCVFPFIYQGLTYHQCAGNVRLGEKPFCAVQVDENGALVDDSFKRFCNMSLEVCQQKCLSIGGDQCLFSLEHQESQMDIDVCSANSFGPVSCPTRGRRKDGNLIPVWEETCQVDSCEVLDTCSTNSSATDGQLASLNYFGQVYPTNTSCHFNYYSFNPERYYRFRFSKLDIHCEDALQIGDLSQTFSYNLCSQYSGPNYRDFELCLPTSAVSLLFDTGNANSVSFQRSGFSATYFTILPEFCEIQNEDIACWLPGGRLVTSPETLYGKFYPLPYPADSTCLWNIVPPSPDVAVRVNVTEFNLGRNYKNFQVSDSIKVSDLSERNVVFGPETLSAYFDYWTINSVPGNVIVLFQSGYLFNYHENFAIEVSFFDIAANLEMYVDEGFCVSRETPDVCQIPFTYEGREYRVCDYLEPSDEQPSCLSYRNEKVVCDVDIVACGRQFPDFTRYDVTYKIVDENMMQVNVSWTVKNSVWNFFQIFLNEEVYEDFFEDTSFSIYLSTEQVESRVEIKVHGFIGEPKSLHLTLYPRTYPYLVHAVSFDNFETVALKRGSTVRNQNRPFSHVDQKLREGLSQLFHIFLSQMEVSRNFENGTNSAEVRLYDLTPGVPYVLYFDRNYTLNFPLTVPPNTLRNLVVKLSLDGGIIASGTLTEDTICYIIVFKITEPEASRKRRSTEETVVECSFDNRCIDSDGHYSADLSEGISQPDTCYNISATSSTNGVNSSPSETTTFCTPPEGRYNAEIPPKPVSYETSSASSGYLKFHVDETVSGFDHVILYFHGSSSGPVSSEGYVCSAEGSFGGGKYHSCFIPGLNSDTDYEISLRGHISIAQSGAQMGFSEMSESFTISQGSTFELSCGSNQYEVKFHLGDLESPQTSFSFQSTTIRPPGSPNTVDGTPFDDQDFIQNTWPKSTTPVFIPPESVPIFRGFPYEISLGFDAEGAIAFLFPRYSFTGDEFQINGNEQVYTNGSWRDFRYYGTRGNRIVSVWGSFNQEYLQSIQFGSVDENGNHSLSDCFGSQKMHFHCSGFVVEQTNPNQFLVGFAGKVDEKGRIVELILNWVTLPDAEYFMGTEDCPLHEQESNLNWHDVEDINFSYKVENLNDCGTERSVDEETRTISYQNQIVRGSFLTAAENASTEDFGNGSMIASRSWSDGDVDILCIYEEDGVVSARWDTIHHPESNSVSDTNAVQFQMLFYTDRSFGTTRSSNEGLIIVSSGENIYFAVSFPPSSNYDMTLYAHTCYAKKTADPHMAEDGSNYLLLQNEGCPAADGTFERFSIVRDESNDKMDPMSIQAFHWFNDYSSLVHLHCNVRACVEENRENCQPPANCGEKRARRGVEDSQVESLVSSPPIRIEQTGNMLVEPLTKQMSAGWFWIPMSLVCGLSVALVVIALERLSKKRPSVSTPQELQSI